MAFSRQKSLAGRGGYRELRSTAFCPNSTVAHLQLVVLLALPAGVDLEVFLLVLEARRVHLRLLQLPLQRVQLVEQLLLVRLDLKGQGEDDDGGGGSKVIERPTARAASASAAECQKSLLDHARSTKAKKEQGRKQGRKGSRSRDIDIGNGARLESPVRGVRRWREVAQ